MLREQGLEGVLHDPWIDRNIDLKLGKQLKIKPWFMNYVFIVINKLAPKSYMIREYTEI